MDQTDAPAAGRRVDWRTPRPAAVGSQVTFVAGFLARLKQILER